MILFQISGIGELLEGLIPYCQRHFSRIDRLDRSTFLLDYTLMGMSVIEPEMEGREEKDMHAIHADPMHADEEALAEAAGVEEQKMAHDEVLKERASSKKRKSNKSRDVAYKKVKGAAAHAKVSAISSF
ncbi:hypothetical protein U1Q18_004966 [Sarracenia purpurea var. burkii]